MLYSIAMDVRLQQYMLNEKHEIRDIQASHEDIFTFEAKALKYGPDKFIQATSYQTRKTYETLFNLHHFVDEP